MTNSADILVWYEIQNWGKRIQHLMDDVITQSMINALIENPPEYCYYEDLEWQQSVFDTAGIHLQKPVVDLLAERLPTAYSYLRVYHACHPTDTKGYYQNGFIPAVPTSLNELAKEYFLGQPGITQDVLDQAIAIVENLQRGGLVYFALDHRNLTAFSQNYLIYGSEYLAVVAHELQRLTGEDCPALLKTIGTPTIFVCDLPFESTVSIRRELSGNLLEALFESFVRPQGELPVIDVTLSISSSIPPSTIVQHYYPDIRRD